MEFERRPVWQYVTSSSLVNSRKPQTSILTLHVHGAHMQFDSDWWCFGNACCGDTDLLDEALDISIDDDPFLVRNPEEIVFGTIEIFASLDIIEELSVVRSTDTMYKLVDIPWSEEPDTECQQEIYDFIDHGDAISLDLCNGTLWMFDGDAFIEEADGFELILGFDSDTTCYGSDCCVEVAYFVYDAATDEQIEDDTILCGGTPAQITNAVIDLFGLEHPGVAEEITAGNPLESMAKTKAERKRHHIDRKGQAAGKMHIPPPQIPESAKHGEAHPNDIILGTFDFEACSLKILCKKNVFFSQWNLLTLCFMVRSWEDRTGCICAITTLRINRMLCTGPSAIDNQENSPSVCVSIRFSALFVFPETTILNGYR